MNIMAGRKGHSAEDIVRKLRRADELAAAGKKGEEIAAELECRRPRCTTGDAPMAVWIPMRPRPAQVVLSWAAQCGSAFLTTSTKHQRIQENYEISALPEDAMRDIQYRDHRECQVQRGG